MSEQVFTAAEVEQARTEGRREANNAITWGTSCLGCADRLDGLYAERVAGARDMIGEIDRLLRSHRWSLAAKLVREYAGKELQVSAEAPEAPSEWDSEGAPS
jgi:hypothetical protein